MLHRYFGLISTALFPEPSVAAIFLLASPTLFVTLGAARLGPSQVAILLAATAKESTARLWCPGLSWPPEAPVRLYPAVFFSVQHALGFAFDTGFLFQLAEVTENH